MANPIQPGVTMNDTPKEPPMRCAKCSAKLNMTLTKGGKWWCPACQEYRHGKGPESLASLLHF